MATGLSFILAILSITFLIFFTALIKLGATLLLSIPFLYASLVMSILSIASHPSINLPLLLCKDSNGCFPIWSTIIFSPYLLLTRWVTELMRLSNGQAPYSEVSEGLYVGGWPSSSEKLPPGEPAIIDCTNELPRNLEVAGQSYLCVPTWDSVSPDVAAIESAVEWACRMKAQKRPIFVHCAFEILVETEMRENLAQGTRRALEALQAHARFDQKDRFWKETSKRAPGPLQAGAWNVGEVQIFGIPLMFRFRTLSRFAI